MPEPETVKQRVSALPKFRFPEAKVRKWYTERVANWKAGDPIPSEEEDLTAAKARFGIGVTRAFIRILRHQLAPPEWSVGTIGRKPNPPSK